MEELLRFENVDIAYGDKKVISQVSFGVKAGQVIGIMGASGSGKSTLLKAVFGILGAQGQVTCGDICYRGKSLLAESLASRRQIYGAHLGPVFQNAGSSFCPTRKIGPQLLERARQHEKMSRKDFNIRAQDMFARLGLKDCSQILSSYPFELSGGMQQRVGIAAAMLLHPDVLLADEPSSALDAISQKAVMAELKAAKENWGTAMVLVSHDMTFLQQLADVIYLLEDGRLHKAWEVQAGARDNMATNPVDIKALPCRNRSENKAFLQVQNLTKTYKSGHAGGKKAVDNISFDLMPGQCLGLIGANGSGKTTLTQLIAGFIFADAGHIYLDDIDVLCLKGSQKRRIYKKLQYVFQQPLESFDPRCTFAAIMTEALKNNGCPQKELKRRTEELFALCGLKKELLKRFPHQVSGGQCQRAAIARALVADPSLLICDEIISALDVESQEEIVDLLLAIKEKKSQMAIIFISHDMSLIKRLCDRVIVMEAGKILAEGPAQEIIKCEL